MRPTVKETSTSSSGRPSAKASGKAAASPADEPRSPSSASGARPPAAPPPRPLGRPLTVRPAWEEVLLDVRDGPIPWVVLASVAAFVVGRLVSSGFVPWAVAVAAGGAAFGVFRYRHQA